MIEMKWWCFNSLFCLLSQCLVWESVGPTDHLVCEEAIPSEGAINWNYRCLYYLVNIVFFYSNLDCESVFVWCVAAAR